MTRLVGITFALLAALAGTSAQNPYASTPRFLNCPASAVDNVKAGTTTQQCGNYTVTVTPDNAQTKCGFGTPSDVIVQLISEGPGGCTLDATAKSTVIVGNTYQLVWEQQGSGQEELSDSFIGLDGKRQTGAGQNNSNNPLATIFVALNSPELDVDVHLRQSNDCITVPGGKQCPPSQFLINVDNLNASTTSTSPSSTSASTTSTRSATTTSSSSATQSASTTSSGQSPTPSGDIAPDFEGCPGLLENPARTGIQRVTCGGNGGSYTITVTPDNAQTQCRWGIQDGNDSPRDALILLTQGPGGCTLDASTTFPVDVTARDYALSYENLAPQQADVDATFISLNGVKQTTGARNGVVETFPFTPTGNTVRLDLHLRQTTDCIAGQTANCSGNAVAFVFGRYLLDSSTSSSSSPSASATASRSSTSVSVTATQTSSASRSATSVSASSSSSVSPSATSRSTSSSSVSPSATSRSTASTTATGTPTATPSSRSQKKRLQEEVQLRLDAEQGQHCPVDTEKCPVAGWTDSWECIDTSNELSSCGGCASTGAGVDCEAIAGIAKHGSQCVAGKCVVKACADGFKVAGAGSLCVAE